jgi:Protein of unknown function (DUF3617)
MRKVLFVAAICMLASVVMAATGQFQPLNVKTGLWQITEISSATGLPPIPPDMQAKLDQMPPEQRAKLEEMIKSRYGGTPHTTTYKKCVKKEDLDKDAFSKPTDKCTWTTVSSTGNDVEVRGTSCSDGKNEGMKGDADIKIHVVDSENATGTVRITVTGNGQTSNINNTLTGKWLGATCPADVN